MKNIELYNTYDGITFACLTEGCETSIHLRAQDQPLKCASCGRKYETNIKIKAKSRDFRYECEKCNLRFQKEVDLREHRNEYHFDL